MTSNQEWRKSSYSADTADCVEVHQALDGLRDSKNPDGPTLAVSVSSLIRAVRGSILGAR